MPETYQDAPIELAALEADFLTGSYTAEGPWSATDDGLDSAIRAPKFGHVYLASPKPSPNPGCCSR